jgi:hypothetical protein
VKAIIFYDDYSKKIEITSVTYDNGEFTLKLPATVNDTYLGPLNLIGTISLPAGLMISNPDVKATNGVGIYAYNASGEKIGEFYYYDSVSGWYSELEYSNGDVSITGADDGEVEKYSIYLKKGWNWIYDKDNIINGKEVYEATTKTPDNMKWYFEEYEVEEVPTSVVEDNTITVTVENGSSYNSKIDVVKAEIIVEDDDIEVSAPYSNGGFTLKLPEPISDVNLEAAFEDEDDYPEGVTVSNRNVKVAYLDEIEGYKSNNYIGDFYNESSDGWELEYIYSNGNVSVTGAGTEEYEYDYNGDGEYEKERYKYNMHLAKGWNIVYFKYIEKENNNYEYEVTTQAPASTIKWYFEDWSSYTPESPDETAVTKKIPTFLSKRKARL